MIIISSGFPKSASTLLFLYTERLIQVSGKPTGQRLFRKFNRDGFTPWFGPLNTMWYLFISMFGPVVIKTHAGPGFFVRILLSLRLAKAYYSVRDPRDVVLSALDHAEKARNKKEMTTSDKAFAPFSTFRDMLPAFDMHYKRFKAWKKDGRVLFLRYEDVLMHPEHELKKIVQHIHQTSLNEYIHNTIEWFAERRKETINFNKGQLVRYVNELNRQEINEIEHEIKEVILGMNYQLSSQ